MWDTIGQRGFLTPWSDLWWPRTPMEALPGLGEPVGMRRHTASGSCEQKGPSCYSPGPPPRRQPHPTVTVQSDRRQGATWLIVHLGNTGVPVKLQGSLWVRAPQPKAEPETCGFVVLAQSHSIFQGGGSGEGPVLQAGTGECVGNDRVRLWCVSHPQAVSPD